MLLAVAAVAHFLCVGALAASLGGLHSTGVLAVTSHQAARPPRVIMADNFTTPSNLDLRAPEHVGGLAWREVTGRWVVRNGYLDPPNSPNALVLWPSVDHDVRAEVVVTVTGAHQFGLVVRGSATGPTFLVGYVSSAGQAVIAKVVNGTMTPLVSVASPAPLGTFTLTLVADAATLQLRRDGVQIAQHVLSSTDALTFGSLTATGLWVSSSGNERLDDIRITEVY